MEFFFLSLASYNSVQSCQPVCFHTQEGWAVGWDLGGFCLPVVSQESSESSSLSLLWKSVGKDAHQVRDDALQSFAEPSYV